MGLNLIPRQAVRVFKNLGKLDRRFVDVMIMEKVFV